MHVGFVISSLVGGGAEKVVLTLAEEMQARGHSVSIFVLFDRVDYRLPENISVHMLTSRRKFPVIGKAGFYRRAADRLKRIVGEQQMQGRPVDLFLYNLPEDYELGHRCSFPGSFYCVHVSLLGLLKKERSHSVFKYWRLRKQLDVLNNKDIVTVSKGIGREVDGIAWLKTKSSKCIYNPHNIERIRELADEAWGVGEEPEFEYIIHVGRAAKQKRHDILFSAFKSVPEQYQLVLLSKDFSKLSRMIEKSGLNDRVQIAGFKDNPYKWIKKACLLVLSSDFEGLGNVLIESIICGTPVVSTDCPYGPSEILTGELSKWLVPVGDVGRLSAAINDVLLAEHINLEHADILQHVSVERVVNEYLELAG